jgi:hypothetical protein
MKNILDVKVSCFKNIFSSTDPREINLITWLKSTKYSKEVDLIRKEKDKEVIKLLKETLPVITPSGLFKMGKNEALIKHSNLLCLDIDFKDNLHIKNYSDLKSELSKIKNIAYCGLSVSGNGYFCLIPILFPEKHKEHYEALKSLFEKIGINIDKQCSNLSRYRFYSYDTDAYFNYSAIPFSQIKAPPQQEQIKEPIQTKCFNNATYGELLINEICNRKIDITNGYREWFEIGCSIANEYGEPGRIFFHSISQFNMGYDYNKTDKQFTECLKNKYRFDINTLFYYCKLHNIYIKDILQTNGEILRTGTPANKKTLDPDIQQKKYSFDVKAFVLGGKDPDLNQVYKTIGTTDKAPF